MPRQSCYVKGPIEEQGPYYFDLRYFQQFIFLKPFLPWPVSFDAQAGYYYLLYRFHPWLSVSSITTSATQWICFKERQTRLTNNKRFVRIFYFFFSFIDKFLITKPTRFLTEELILHPSKHFCTAVGIYTQLGLQSSFTRAVYGLGAPKWEITSHKYWHKSTKTGAQKLLPPGWHGAAVGSTVTSPQKVPGSYPNWSFPVLSLHVSHVPARDWSWSDSST